jgi:transposase-like protein
MQGDPACVPHTRERRCWPHKVRSVLAALRNSAHPGTRKALAQMHNAADKDHVLAAATEFAADFGAKWRKAVAKTTDDLDVLLTLYDFLTEHWIYRTTDAMESTFATVRLRTRSPRDSAPEPPVSRTRSSSSSALNADGVRSIALDVVAATASSPVIDDRS